MPDPDAPWWSAGDDEYAGATPMFEGAAAEEPGDEPGAPTGPGEAPQVGSAIGEALKFAAALTAWSEQSGLTDPLKTIAAEAADALSDPDGAAAAASEAAEVPLLDPHTTVVVCDFCPVCRGMDVVRQAQPHLAQGLAEAMSSLTQALNLAVESFTASHGRSGP